MSADFYTIKERPGKKDSIEIYPDFRVIKSKDLMIRGGRFHAVWDEETGLWSTDEYTVQRMVDADLTEYRNKRGDSFDGRVNVEYMVSSSTGSWMQFRKYANNLPDNSHELDARLTFSDTPVVKKDYISKRLSYPLAEGDHSAWDEIVGTLYLPEEREKIEWAIGAIVSGDSRDIQKFLVFYGDPGHGKGTILAIINKLFGPYTVSFDAGELTGLGNSFPMEQFRNNPLVAIQYDGDLSHIASNTKLNSLVSHEPMLMKEKFKSSYDFTPHCFLFLASNEPVKITSAKSGIIRRLIDVTPSMQRIPTKRYFQLTHQVDFELGAIAKHCLDVYTEMGKHYYDGYKPMEMMFKTDPFFNFVDFHYMQFSRDDGVSLKNAYDMYKDYCENSGLQRLPMYKFREEMKNYFTDFQTVARIDGQQVRSWYSGFDRKKFDITQKGEKENGESGNSEAGSGRGSAADGCPEDAGKHIQDDQYVPEGDHPGAEHAGYSEPADGAGDGKAGGAEGDEGNDGNQADRGVSGLWKDLTAWLVLEAGASLLDEALRAQPAQYANEDDKPTQKWAEVRTRLCDILTRKTHYVRVPMNHIVIDFDLKGPDGKKSLRACLLEAAKWKPTYAEVSKGGGGLHLHYIYDGDISELANLYAPGIEVKTFRGNSSLRRRVSRCNDIPIAHLSSGLPKKEVKPLINFEAVQNEKGLRRLIERNMNKEIHPGTKPSIDFIEKILDDAYAQGLHYDVSDMRPDITDFAIHSSHQAEYCLTRVAKMKFQSADISEPCLDYSDERLVFFDIEVFPNLVLVNWKFAGDDTCQRMINPKPAEIEALMKYRLVGFNCRRYDNHILYAIYLGKSIPEIYDISQGIIGGSRNATFSEAYNISYTDVYDFCSKKQSLKKWEIELGIHHQELGLPWDQPVPEEKWLQVAEYCDNDVFATEAVFNARQADWTARQILADIAEMTVNDTTNSLTTRIIFGRERNPQKEFNYRFMGTGPDVETYCFPAEAVEMHCDPKYTAFTSDGKPIFPGYSFDHGKSLYRGEEVGEGGYVYAEPGIHRNVALLDIASMHPSSIVAENLFGEYTEHFRDILQARIYIKHKEYDKAKELFGGKLAAYLDDPSQAKALAGALKIAINSVYGLTSAKFDNAFRDIRNIDNIVAKRGALFMVNLKHEVQRRGYTVAHIKTDSIKIPDAGPDIIQFVMDYGKMYGYNFEHEATYDRMCLVNDAVYIAKYADTEEGAGEWTATGAQFQVPYIFKTLFSREPIRFSDLCETKSCTTALYLDMNENLTDVSQDEKDYDRIRTRIRKLEKTLTDSEYNPDMEKPFTDLMPDDAEKIRNEIEDLNKDLDILKEMIAEGHNYVFIGKVGLFTPVRPGKGGGLLMREKDGKYYAVGGTSGYRWMEAESCLGDLSSMVDMRYFDSMTEEAVKAIEVYGDFWEFVYGEPRGNSALPWEHIPTCPSPEYPNCLDCPHWRLLLNAESIDEFYGCDCT